MDRLHQDRETSRLAALSTAQAGEEKLERLPVIVAAASPDV
jgi:hypothetical protein